MNEKEIMAMWHQLSEASEKEAHKLYRLRWRAKAHGVSNELEQQILGEALWLHNTGTAYPERILKRINLGTFKFAFK